MQQCHAPRLVAVTKFKTTKINFEGLFGLSTKIRLHENYPPYNIIYPLIKQLPDENFGLHGPCVFTLGSHVIH